VETLRHNTISNKSIWIQRNCCTTQKKIWKETRQQIISSHIQEVEEEHIWKKEMIQFELKKVSFSTLLSSLNKTTWYKYKKENIGLMGWDNFKNGYPRFSQNVCCTHWAGHITRNQELVSEYYITTLLWRYQKGHSISPRGFCLEILWTRWLHNFL